MVTDLSAYRLTLVLVPQDLRAGFKTLAQLAEQRLAIDVFQKRDAVVFLSKRRTICKIIVADEHGSNLLTRVLHYGCFRKLTAVAEGKASAPITKKQLLAYLDGGDI